MDKNNRNRALEVNQGYKIMTKIVKEQNRLLLYEIARFKELNSEETEEFVAEFLKPNYYMLDVTGIYKKEKIQRNFIY